MLIFGYFGAIIAWIFTSGSIPALIWDIIYSLACIIATIGLCLNNYLTIIILLIAYLVDVLIALLAIVVILNADDLSVIIGEADVDRDLFLIVFIFFTIAQSLFSIEL